MFGALAGDGHAGVVPGLHVAAAIAVGLLLCASALAFFCVGGRRD